LSHQLKGKLPRSAVIRTPCVVVLILSIALGCGDAPSEKPFLRMDLRASNFSTGNSGTLAASYSGLVFLSDDLVLVVVNERRWSKAIEISDTDLPPARFLLVDVKKNAIVGSTYIRTEKNSGAVQRTAGNGFVVWNDSGVELCDVELTCTQHAAFSGPVIVSPRGTSISVGGWGQSNQHLLDGSSLRQLATYPWNDPALVPGDGVLLLRYAGHKFFIKEGHATEKAIPLIEAVPNEILPPQSRFVSHSTIAVNETNGSIVLTDLSGRPLHRFGVSESFRHIDVISCPCENKFAIREQRYSSWNSLTNFIDIEHTRPYDVEELRIFDVSSGALEFSLIQDPRPYLPALPVPALSPTGQRIALVHRGFLEVYELP
jgi:hypothetical protein